MQLLRVRACRCERVGEVRSKEVRERERVRERARDRECEETKTWSMHRGASLDGVISPIHRLLEAF